MGTVTTRWIAGGLLGIAIGLGGFGPATGFAQDQTGSEAETGTLSGIQINNDEPILIESDRLEVRENDNIAIFSGNVSVVQGKTLLKSKKLRVFYADDGGSAATGSANIDRLEAEGRVYVKSDAQVATGDRGTYDMKSEVMVLSGKNVVLTEGENSAVGCKLTIHTKSGLAQLESCKERVKILIAPKSTN